MPKLPADHDLSLPPHTVQEMEQAKARIQLWHRDGAVLSLTPVLSLSTCIHQTLSTAGRLLRDLEDPASQPMAPERKKKFWETFRGVVVLHAASTLDVEGLRAMCVKVHLNSEREEMEKWQGLVRMLWEKEELMEVLAEKVVELERELEKEVKLAKDKEETAG